MNKLPPSFDEEGTITISQDKIKKLKKYAISAAQEVLSRPEEFPLNDSQQRLAVRIRKNMEPGRQKHIQPRDIVHMCRIGRYYLLVPEQE